MSLAQTLTDTALYDRGAETLLASWREYANGSESAMVLRLPGVSAAIFPHEPERGVYNNALLRRGLGSPERIAAFVALQDAYAACGVDRFAAWVHERDAGMRASAEECGYTLDTSTRAMGMSLAKAPAQRPALHAERVGWSEYLDVFDLPEGLLDAADMSAFHILGVRGDGGVVATAMAYDHDRDCGIYNVGTAEHARRRGIATALTALLLRDAWARGCTTASVQATQMAEGVYAKLGFRDLGRFLEYVP